MVRQRANLTHVIIPRPPGSHSDIGAPVAVPLSTQHRFSSCERDLRVGGMLSAISADWYRKKVIVLHLSLRGNVIL